MAKKRDWYNEADTRAKLIDPSISCLINVNDNGKAISWDKVRPWQPAWYCF